jgi:hypothetical protein
VAIHAVVKKIGDDAIVTAGARRAQECAVMCHSAFYNAVAGAVNGPLNGNSKGGDTGSRYIFDAGRGDGDGPFIAHFLVKSFVEGCLILWGLGRFVIASFCEGLKVQEAV